MTYRSLSLLLGIGLDDCLLRSRLLICFRHLLQHLVHVNAVLLVSRVLDTCVAAPGWVLLLGVVERVPVSLVAAVDEAFTRRVVQILLVALSVLLLDLLLRGVDGHVLISQSIIDH